MTDEELIEQGRGEVRRLYGLCATWAFAGAIIGFIAGHLLTLLGSACK